MITDVGEKPLTESTVTTVCENVFSIFTNLQHLNLCSFAHVNYPQLSFESNLPTFFSSTLIELHINVRSSNDFFHLLDGRFSQLRVLLVNMLVNTDLSPMFSNKVGYYM